MISEYFFPDRDSLFNALLEDCKTILTAALEDRSTASLMLSGGNSPKPFYQQLSSVVLDWQRVSVAMVDERWVDTGHAGSNERLITDTLLKNNAAMAKLIGMKNSEKAIIDGLPICELRYQQLNGPFDFTLLGMGPDGHTASLFPKAQGLDDALDLRNEKLCAVIEATPSKVTGELTERMTLSLFGLLQSRQLHLLITGEEKLAVYKAALQCSDITATPIAAVLQQEAVPVNVYWAP